MKNNSSGEAGREHRAPASIERAVEATDSVAGQPCKRDVQGARWTVCKAPADEPCICYLVAVANPAPQWPQRVWIDFRGQTASGLWRVYTAPNFFAETEYVRDSALVAERDALRAATLNALEWFAGFPHQGTASHFDKKTADDVSNHLESALATKP